MRIQTTIAGAVVIALAALATACSHDTVAPSDPATDSLAAQMVEIELEANDTQNAALDGEIGAAAAVAAATQAAGTTTKDLTFSGSRQCPAGGEIAWEGTLHVSYDRDTRVLEATFSGSRTMTDCGFVRGPHTIVVNGSSHVDVFRRLVDGRFDGPQTTHAAGSYEAVRSDGERKSCSFEITIVFDPDARTLTLTGTVCGVDVNRVVRR